MRLDPQNVKVLLPEDHHVRVIHFHQGNDPKGATRRMFQRAPTRHLPRYATVAEIKNGTGIVSVGVAVCSHGDSPDRKYGWSLAVERALQGFIDHEVG